MNDTTAVQRSGFPKPTPEAQSETSRNTQDQNIRHPEAPPTLEELERNSGLGRLTIWLINGLMHVFTAYDLVTRGRTGPPPESRSEDARPTHDITGERILYDREGIRVGVMFQYEWTWWDKIGVFLSMPWLMWRIFRWVMDGQGNELPDPTPYKPHGPMLPEIKQLWREQEEREKGQWEDEAKISTELEAGGNNKSDQAEGGLVASIPKAP